MNLALVERLRSDLLSAKYDAHTVRTLIGEAADDARQRGVFAPALRVVEHREESLSLLVRLFLLGQELPHRLVNQAMPMLTTTGAVELGLVEYTNDETLRAILSLNPVSIVDSLETHEWWIVSDLDDHLRGGEARRDHVMGVGGATRSLIAQLPAVTVSKSLDMGTGCGAVALHLALRGPVVACDISLRALQLAQLNAVLNEMQHQIEFRHGDLFEPVNGEQFELIASNPPFVVTPRNHGAVPTYEYRDGGKVGDELAQSVVTQGPAYLQPFGTLICLANWESPWGKNGLNRVKSWIENAAVAGQCSLAAWVIERDRLTVEQYAETWVRDGGIKVGDARFDLMMRAWLADFDERQITAIGLGAVRVQKIDAEPRTALVHLDQASGAYASEGLGRDLERVFATGLRASRMSDSQVLAARWVRHENVIELRTHRPGAESPRAISLQIDQPMYRAVTADTLLAGAIGACDGELTLAQISDALATLLEVDAGACRVALSTSARELAWLGMLLLPEE